MKSPTLIICIILLALNILFGLILSSYGWTNVSLTSLAIVSNGILMYLVSVLPIKNGFRVSFNCLFPLFAIVEIGCGIAAPEQIEDNGQFITIIVLLFIQVLLIVASNAISKNVD